MPDDHTPKTPSSENRRREYLNNYQASFREKHHRLELTLTNEEFDRLKEEAKRRGTRVATLAREALFAHLNEEYLLPDPDRVRDLDLALRAIGNDVSQMAHRGGESTEPGQTDMTRIHEQLATLEDMIDQMLRRPPALLPLVSRALEDNREFRRALQHLLQTYG